jgi:hypothetical protein
VTTTDTIAPLLVPRDETDATDGDDSARLKDDAIEILNKHGVALYEDLLALEEAEALRSYILSENLNLERERAGVLDNRHWEHLTFGLDEHPTISNAVHSIVTSQPLRGVLESMLGKDVALVDLDSIPQTRVPKHNTSTRTRPKAVTTCIYTPCSYRFNKRQKIWVRRP